MFMVTFIPYNKKKKVDEQKTNKQKKQLLNGAHTKLFCYLLNVAYKNHII